MGQPTWPRLPVSSNPKRKEVKNIMVLPGECVNEGKTICIECCAKLEIAVHRSAAGWYLGFFCLRCGPYSRESGYYHSAEAAKEALDRGTYSRY
jgi:hypothetical protein